MWCRLEMYVMSCQTYCRNEQTNTSKWVSLGGTRTNSHTDRQRCLGSKTGVSDRHGQPPWWPSTSCFSRSMVSVFWWKYARHFANPTDTCHTKYQTTAVGGLGGLCFELWFLPPIWKRKNACFGSEDLVSAGGLLVKHSVFGAGHDIV